MLVLALDTATPAVTAGVVELTGNAVVERSVRVAHDARKHAELLMPEVLGACADAGVALRDVDAVVTGTGPGPFTGLRVGMVTAAALGDALGIPVHGVCSLDAIAAASLDAGPVPDGPILVVTDARRREVYWALYDGEGGRISGPHVETPAVLTARVDGWAPSPQPVARPGCSASPSGSRRHRRPPGSSRWRLRRCAPGRARARSSRSTCAGPTPWSPAPASR